MARVAPPKRQGLTLDTGALIAAEKGVESFWAFFRRALERKALVSVPAPVVAQAWRGKSPVIARLLRGCVVEGFDEDGAKRVGTLLAASKTSDIVDAAVVVSAAKRQDLILTSDAGDIERLIDASGTELRVLRV